MTEIIGRDRELAVCAGVLGRIATEPAGGVLIAGEPGIGKTTLYRAVVGEAAAQGYRVLSYRPAEAEARLSYVALGDLLADVVEDVLPRLSELQRRALEVALLRLEPDGPLRQRAVAVAFLSALTVLAEQRPVVVAVDDIQWLDPPSARVLAYAFRRLGEEPIAFLLSVRSVEDRAAPRDALARNLPEDRTRRVQLGGFSIGGLHRILRTQLDGLLPRPLLVRVATASGGNPLFALEIARAVLGADAQMSPGDALPVPESIANLLADRIGVLSPRCQRALLVASAMVHPTPAGIDHVLGRSEEAASALAEAEDASIVKLDGERIGFAHPLFASSLYASAGAATRRRLHRQLADVATDLEERAWHLARGVTGTDAEAAQVLEDAARAARVRGAPDSAAELAQVSRRLTPTAAHRDAARRAMEAADCCFEAGDTARARALLEEIVAELPRGSERSEALLRLACVRHYNEDRHEALALLTRALREAGDAPALRGWIHAVFARAHAWTNDVDAVSHARTALRLAEQSGDAALLFLALTAVAMSEVFAGNGLRRQHLKRALALEEPTSFLTPVLVAWHPWINFASLLIYVEEFETARARLEAMLQHAIEGGDEGSIPELRFWLGELECRAGNFALAKRHAVAGYEAALDVGQQLMVAQLSSTRALAHGHLGEIEEATAAAEHGLAIATTLESAPSMIRNLAALGFLELSAGHSARASARLGSALDVARSTGYREPGQFVFVGNLIESLVATGDLASAARLTEELEEQGERLDRGWARVSARRGRALLAAADGRLEEAAAAVEDALRHHSRLPMPFETARTLLVKGQIERRRKRRGAARETLTQALDAFEALGAKAWAEQARAELARVSGKAARTDLTPTELRVARLVADGLSNKQAAAALFVSVKAVEKNLARVYTKLGINSRAQLVRTVERGEMPPPPGTATKE